ncbi:4334_t:CDS:1, partial [Racocetra persica]
NTKIGKVEFECDIQYKEIATEQANTTVNCYYQFYGNRKLDFEHVKTEIADDSLENRETISENTNRDQIHEIIELSSDEDCAPEIIELSSDDESQTPEIIELSSDEEVVFEENQTAVSRDRTPETAE